MGLALLDSSVIIGALDANDSLHAAAASTVRELATSHRLGASVIVVAEVMSGAKTGHHDEKHVRAFFARGIAERLIVDEPIAIRAAELRGANAALRLPDALILATGESAADVVVTADARWRKVRGLRCAVRIVS
jgi:predicted nucleic acid-binding protein